MHGRFLLWVDYSHNSDFDWFPCFCIVKQPSPMFASADYDITFIMMLDSLSNAPLDFQVLLKIGYPNKNGLLHDF